MQNEPQKGIMKNCKNSAHDILGNENEECQLCPTGEPQLSAEMERKYEEEFGNVYSSKAGAKIGDELRVGSMCNIQLKHFLATALEEQKEHEKTLMAKSNDWWNKHLATAITAAKREERERILADLKYEKKWMNSVSRGDVFQDGAITRIKIAIDVVNGKGRKQEVESLTTKEAQ